MEEAEPEKQRRMVTKSLIKRKPFANLTNIIRKPYHTSSSSQSEKLEYFTAAGVSPTSNSSIGSTQHPIRAKHPITVPPNHSVPSTPQRLKHDDCIGDENHIAYGERHSTQKTRSKTKTAAVPSYQTSVEKTTSDGKEGSMPCCSSLVEKIRDQEMGNQPSLDKTKNDGKEISAALHCSSVEKIKDKRKASDVRFSSSDMKNERNSIDTPMPHPTVKIKDKGKASNVQFSSSDMKNGKSSIDTPIPHPTVKIKDKGKENAMPSSYPPIRNRKNNLDTMPTLMKRKDKGKAISVPLNYPPTQNVKDNMVGIDVPLSGVKMKDKGKSVMGSSLVDCAKTDERKVVATPIDYCGIQKRDKGSSCPPLSRTRHDRNGVDGSEDISQSKSQTDPPPIKKKRRCSSKEGAKEYALPQDFVDQQRAYFKEIDDFELEVEEVSD